MNSVVLAVDTGDYHTFPTGRHEHQIGSMVSRTLRRVGFHAPGTYRVTIEYLDDQPTLATYREPDARDSKVTVTINTAAPEARHSIPMERDPLGKGWPWLVMGVMLVLGLLWMSRYGVQP